MEPEIVLRRSLAFCCVAVFAVALTGIIDAYVHALDTAAFGALIRVFFGIYRTAEDFFYALFINAGSVLNAVFLQVCLFGAGGDF